MTVLKSLQAKKRVKEGPTVQFKKGTFNELVDSKLRELAISQKQFGKAPGNKKENNNDNDQ